MKLNQLISETFVSFVVKKSLGEQYGEREPALKSLPEPRQF